MTQKACFNVENILEVGNTLLENGVITLKKLPDLVYTRLGSILEWLKSSSILSNRAHNYVSRR